MLPVLLAVLSGAVLVALQLDVRIVLPALVNLSTVTFVTAAGCGFVLMLLTAYVLLALRPVMLECLCGQSSVLQRPFWGLWRLGRFRAERRFRRLSADALAPLQWRPTLDTFVETMRDAYTASQRAPVSADTEAALLQWVTGLRSVRSPDLAQPMLTTLTAFFRTHDPDALSSVYAVVKEVLTERVELAAVEQQAAATALDREFGRLGTLRSTQLGNLVQSYNEYPLRRYGMEAYVFWPRLQSVVPEAQRALLAEGHLGLDFAVTMTILAALGAVGIAVLVYATLIDAGLGVVGMSLALVGSWFFYRLACTAAARYGELVRATYDLYRLELLQRLGRQRPLRFAEEQRQWEELSQLITLGAADLDFPLDAPAHEPEPKRNNAPTSKA